MPDALLTLRARNARCTIAPAAGGSLTAWVIDDQPLFRSASATDIAERNPLGMASFPLVPYSNRIGNGRFAWDGAEIALAPNFAPEPHAIHGVGWRRDWHVAEAAQDSARLIFSGGGEADWPWPFDAEQRITLTADRLTLSLSATNRHDHPVPLAFGHHPYFDSAGATLSFAADRVWMTDTDALPYAAVQPAGEFDFTQGPVEGRDVDHCYTGWDGIARIAWAGRAFAVEIVASPNLSAAVVYVPTGGSAFCFEPVPHIINALNLHGHAPAMPIVAPGKSFRTEIVFKAIG